MSNFVFIRTHFKTWGTLGVTQEDKTVPGVRHKRVVPDPPWLLVTVTKGVGAAKKSVTM